MFFKGYIEADGKKAVEPFKNKTKFKSFEEVQSLPSYGGVLTAETILIDIDETEASDILLRIVEKFNLKCRVYQTERGKHFLFKNTNDPVNSCSTHSNLAIGIKADIKVGLKATYEILKKDGKPREILRDCNEDEAAELPKWLRPIKANQPFLDMEVGDGRNQALFNYILPLQGAGFTVDECRECIRIINQFMLKQPLSDAELDVILRDAAFAKPVFFQKGKLLHDVFAKFLKNNHNIIKINKQLHIYKDGIYVTGTNEIEAVMIEHIPILTAAKRTEVLKYLDILIMENTEVAPPHLIAFKNGIYDLSDDTLKPFSPEIVITNRIPWNYNPEAYSELADKTLNKVACNDLQIRRLLEECIGSCFYRSSTLGGGKCFILTGERNNGKSTYFNMIENVLGVENITSLDLKELDAKFQNAELFGKLANIGDDIGDEFIPNPAVFKKLVTGNRVQVQRKGERPFEFNNYAKLLFSANNIPRIKDRTGAVLRRLLIIPFNASFSVDDPDYDEEIGFKLRSEEVMEYLIQISVKALKGVLDRHKYSESEKVQAEIKDYEEMNNPIKAFISECDDEGYNMIRAITSEVYLKYTVFCTENGYQKVTQKKFTKDINTLLGFETRRVRLKDKNSGRPVYIFVRKEIE